MMIILADPVLARARAPGPGPCPLAGLPAPMQVGGTPARVRKAVHTHTRVRTHRIAHAHIASRTRTDGARHAASALVAHAWTDSSFEPA